jgi:putative Holliday junction resolvase
MKYIGIDYGQKKTGIALSDESGAMGFPHSILDTGDDLAGQIHALAKGERVGAIGISNNLVGEENAIVKEIRQFGDALHEATHLPVYFEDEAFTTQEANRALSGEGRKDASAAALILSRFLEKQPGRKTYDDID